MQGCEHGLGVTQRWMCVQSPAVRLRLTWAMEGSNRHAPSTANTASLFCWLAGMLAIIFIIIEQGRFHPDFNEEEMKVQKVCHDQDPSGRKWQVTFWKQIFLMSKLCSFYCPMHTVAEFSIGRDFRVYDFSVPGDHKIISGIIRTRILCLLFKYFSGMQICSIKVLRNC